MKLFAVGYPKSGNTWITAVIAHSLGVPALTAGSGIFPERQGVPASDSQVTHVGTRVSHVCKVHGLGFLRERSNLNWIYVVRDPRDVVTSYYYYTYWYVRFFQGKVGYSLRSRTRHAALRFPPLARYHFSRFLRHQIPSWQAHCLEALELNPRSVIRYEDCLRSPVDTFERALNAIGATVPRDRIQEAVAHYDFKRLVNNTERSDRPSFLRKGVAGDWRTRFTAADERLFEAMLDARLRSYLYS